MSGGETVRDVSNNDVPWMADVMVDRRAVYENYSPVFWHPANDARQVHEPYLASCVASDRFVGVRTTHGFLLGELQAANSPPWWPDAPIGFVDDFAVLSDHDWMRDGRQLLLAAWSRLRERGAEALRVVTAVRDTPKVALLESLGLTVGELWCVRTIDARAAGAQFGPISQDGIDALLIPAPPVCDPGGPVLLVTSVAADNVSNVPDLAAQHGAVLAILPTKPHDADLNAAARASAFDETTHYYVGQPAAL